MLDFFKQLGGMTVDGTLYVRWDAVDTYLIKLYEGWKLRVDYYRDKAEQNLKDLEKCEAERDSLKEKIELYQGEDSFVESMLQARVNQLEKELEVSQRKVKSQSEHINKLVAKKNVLVNQLQALEEAIKTRNMRIVDLEAEVGALKADNPSPEPPPKWECFIDRSYYGLMAVRRSDQRGFHQAIHVTTKGEAEFLVEQLNRGLLLEGFLDKLNSPKGG